jgi:hypothetical protein
MKGRGHRHLRAVGEAELAVRAQLLDAREDVVPAADVEPAEWLAQLPEDLVHLEGRGQRLDQHRRAHRALRNAERVLREHEDVVPEPRLEVRLHLRQVVVGTAAAREALLRGVEEVEAEVEERSGDGGPVDRRVLLVQVPAARARDETACRSFSGIASRPARR